MTKKHWLCLETKDRSCGHTGRYVLIIHGGGATPVAQTPDTDLNEDVRRLYGNKECALLMEKMRYGQTVPKLSHEECMDLMWTGTANLTTCSSETAVAAGRVPPAECMFKGARDETVHKRLNEHRRQRAFPSWFTVSVSEKGSYREHDVIAFLKQHLEPWTEGRDWRIIFADDYRAHKT